MKLSPAARVAAGATAVIAVVYVIGVIVLNLLVSSHLTGQNDQRLAERLTGGRARSRPSSASGPPRTGPPAADDDDADDDAAPVFLWAANAAGPVTAHSPGAPALPAGVLAAQPRATGSPTPPAWARRARSG